MKLTTIREIYKNREAYLDKEVTVGGWVRSVRDSKTFGFIVLHDGSYFETLQIVYHDEMENFAEISKMNVGAAIIVKGTLVATPQAKQPFEIQATEVTVEGVSAPDYPLQKKRHSMEYLRTISHLRPRTNTFQAVFRVRSLCAYAIHQFFQERDFVYVNTPLITGSDCIHHLKNLSIHLYTRNFIDILFRDLLTIADKTDQFIQFIFHMIHIIIDQSQKILCCILPHLLSCLLEDPYSPQLDLPIVHRLHFNRISAFVDILIQAVTFINLTLHKK